MGVAVVTGASGGIGLAIAKALAAEHETVLISRNESSLADACAEVGGRSLGLAADLSRPDEVSKVSDAIRGRYESVDVLVNNAGSLVPVADTDDPEVLATDWTRSFQTNLLGAVLLTERLRAVLRRPGGRVIAISSIAGYRGGQPAYAAMKAALQGWAFSLADELGPDGITVNLVAPGYVAGTAFFGTDGPSPDRQARLIAQTMVGRAGEAHDVAAAVSYLASAGAGYVTAQVLHVNGGSLPRC
jgi:3-oxoacyl-[acyl-carrier protein] reductase